MLHPPQIHTYLKRLRYTVTYTHQPQIHDTRTSDTVQTPAPRALEMHSLAHIGSLSIPALVADRARQGTRLHTAHAQNQGHI
jgi:hypothetical protein